MTVRQGLEYILPGRGEIEIHLFETYGAVHLLEGIEMESVHILQAHVAHFVVADGPYRGSHCPGAAKERIGEFQKYLSLLDRGLYRRLALSPETNRADYGRKGRKQNNSF